ncbi:hypothetical protein JTB14_020917 [Gonioctena quinquepunctata]|nr:hypothetical protein JTB14_020917 [Gonioctena quinquepunctata]
MVFYCSPLVLFALLVVFLETCKLETRNSKFNRQRLHSYYASYMDTTTCRTVPGLTKDQIDLCYRQPDATLVALQGLNQAVNECQYQFQGHRWNCSSLKTRGQNPYISSILQRGM